VIYTVHSIFHTLQGEGVHSGKVAVFVRFAGCNLWSGREGQRTRAVCKFCDTQFVGGQRMTRQQIIDEVSRYPGMIVFTGGEPALQLDAELVRALQKRGRYVAIETNGTRPVSTMLDWVCVSPKAGTTIVVDCADELKLVYPQQGMEPWLASARIRALHQWLSPMDGPDWQANASAAIAYAKMDARWRVNIQAHKFWGVE
jgi:7-carboxy-7-deazaguanine synthase (Cx14CxxC type)